MTVRSGFFNSVNGDRKYDAGRFAEYFASFIGNGVFPNPATSLQVASNNDMTVTVQAGKAWINGYILINDGDYVLALDSADGVLNRIDRIVARYDTADREIRLEVKKGTFASSPVAPALQRDADAYELGIADIYVAAGAVSVSQANITDLRMNSNYCGIVAGTVNQIDTTNLFAQYQAAFEDWFQDLQDVLDENTAANLLNLINQNTSAIEQVGDNLAAHKADLASQEAGKGADMIAFHDPNNLFTATNVRGALEELFTSVSDGKNLLETAITDMGGTVSKVGDVATFDELDTGIRSISSKQEFYTDGIEIITFDIGHSSGSGSQSKQASCLNMTMQRAGDIDSIRTYVSSALVDLSKLRYLHIEWENTTGGASSASRSRIGLSQVKTDDNYEISLLELQQGFTKRVDTIDVSALNGQYFIKVSARALIVNNTQANVNVYKIWGEG